MPPPRAGTPFTLVVSLGTDHHGFDRLLDWVGEWVREKPFEVDAFVQAGFTRAGERPGFSARTVDFLPQEELLHWFAGSDAVILQGGPGGIMASRMAGRLPIVVPRRRDLGEHVDDHQVIFARAMAEAGRVLTCESKEELWRVLDQIAEGGLDATVSAGSVGAGRAALRVGATIAARPIARRTVMRRLGFVIAHAADHRFRAHQ